MGFAAAPVIFDYSSELKETQWIWDEVLQQDSVEYLGPSPTWNKTIPITQVQPEGILYGGTSLNVSTAQLGLGEVELTTVRNTQLAYENSNPWPFFISTLVSFTSITAYLLGGPGTPFEMTISLASTVPAGTESAVASTIAYSTPGYEWLWSTPGEAPEGFTATVTGVTNETTIVYENELYSEVQLFMEFSQRAGHGNTSPSDPYSYASGVQTVETLQIRNLAIPEPSAGLLSLLAGVFFCSRRTKRGSFQTA